MDKIRKYFPLWTIIIFSLGAVSLGIYILFRAMPEFAEFYNTTVSAAARWLFAKISGIANFSLTEFLIFMLPVILVYVGIFTARAVNKGAAAVVRIFVSVLALACFVFVSFVNLFAAGYFAVPVEKKMNLHREDITLRELEMTFLCVTREINLLVEENSFSADTDGATVLPYSYGEVADKISCGFAAVNAETKIVQEMKTRVKPIILSEPMTYSHISGVYTFFTGEANVNVNFPDYIVVSTMAHEMAHQRGVAPEDEASFVGYLALINSGDPYLEYCGYMDVYSYLSSALFESGSENWSAYRSLLCSEASAELRAYSDFFDKYRENVVNDMTEVMNDVYLQSQGTEGTVAYDLVTELVVAHTVR